MMFISLFLLIDKWPIKFDTKISLSVNIFEIISTGITALLAIYVTRTLSKKNDLEKNEKGLLINILHEFVKLVREKIYKILDEDDFDVPQTRSDMKILRKKAGAIIEIAEKHKFLDKENSLSVKLKSNVRDIWELLTECPRRANDSNDENHITNDLAKLRLHKQNKIESLLIEIECIVFELTLEINRK